MARRRFKQERFTEAAYHAGRAAELKPELADIHNQLGLAYCRLERFEEGIAEYRKALQLKKRTDPPPGVPGVAKIRANLANALAITANHLSESVPTAHSDEAMHRYDEAVLQYEESLEHSTATARDSSQSRHAPGRTRPLRRSDTASACDVADGA